VPAVAHAHFFLDSPENWTEQDDQGDPQKTGPCGSEGNPMGNDVVTPYMAGETVMIQLHETVFHAGHFRVALGVDGEASLPPAPMTTGTCASAVVQEPPVFPILADGELEHTQKLNGMQTISVTLPTDVNCENCVLQVIQYMRGATMGCFYHHCANISISGGMGSGGMGSGGMSSGGAPSAGAGGTGGQGIGGMSMVSGGMGGTVGQGGVAPTTGGASGTGGTLSTGGAGGSSGSSVGGSSGTTSASGGMTTLPMGGRAASTGGSSGTGGMPASGGAAPVNLGRSEPPIDEGGCSLSPASPKSGAALLGIAGLLALGLALARRRRR
jgi:MYXO-CTERM domain-containing protein